MRLGAPLPLAYASPGACRAAAERLRTRPRTQRPRTGTRCAVRAARERALRVRRARDGARQAVRAAASARTARRRRSRRPRRSRWLVRAGPELGPAGREALHVDRRDLVEREPAVRCSAAPTSRPSSTLPAYTLPPSGATAKPSICPVMVERDLERASPRRSSRRASTTPLERTYTRSASCGSTAPMKTLTSVAGSNGNGLSVQLAPPSVETKSDAVRTVPNPRVPETYRRVGSLGATSSVVTDTAGSNAAPRWVQCAPSSVGLPDAAVERRVLPASPKTYVELSASTVCGAGRDREVGDRQPRRAGPAAQAKLQPRSCAPPDGVLRHLEPFDEADDERVVRGEGDRWIFDRDARHAEGALAEPAPRGAAVARDQEAVRRAHDDEIGIAGPSRTRSASTRGSGRWPPAPSADKHAAAQSAAAIPPEMRTRQRSASACDERPRATRAHRSIRSPRRQSGASAAVHSASSSKRGFDRRAGDEVFVDARAAVRSGALCDRPAAACVSRRSSQAGEGTSAAKTRARARRRARARARGGPSRPSSGGCASVPCSATTASNAPSAKGRGGPRSPRGRAAPGARAARIARASRARRRDPSARAPRRAAPSARGPSRRRGRARAPAPRGGRERRAPCGRATARAGSA